jgi:hypothetical protein
VSSSYPPPYASQPPNPGYPTYGAVNRTTISKAGKIAGWIGVAVMVLSVVGGVAAVIKAGQRVGNAVHDLTSGPAYATPMDETVSLKGGGYVIYTESLGLSGAGASPSFSSGLSDLSVSDVTVTDSSGGRLAVTNRGQLQTVSRGSATFYGGIGFRTPGPGRYRIEISRSTGGHVLVVQDFGVTARRAVGWVIVALCCIPLFFVGLAVTIVGFTRRTQAQPARGAGPVQGIGVQGAWQQPPGQAAPGPPPGWYPDPQTGRSRYWDGSRWIS